MIPFHEAKVVIHSHARSAAEHLCTTHQKIPVTESFSRVAACDVFSPVAVPPFDNSAMDGFALRSLDTKGASKIKPVSLRIVGTIAAGDADVESGITTGCAIRLMTGAPLPKMADTVIMQEETRQLGEEIEIAVPIPPGANIRRQGEDVMKGDVVLRKGERVSPGIAALLASVGIAGIEAIPLPRVAIFATGNELASPGIPLKPGQIYESNTAFLRNALDEMRLPAAFVKWVRDEPRNLGSNLAQAMESSDVVIITGGVSVGRHDHTRDVLKTLSVNEHFWKVAQKPGKPFTFGTKDRCLVFGLPGNPYAVFACFYLYVYPTLRLLMGVPQAELKRGYYPLANRYEKKDEKTHILKGAFVREGNAMTVSVLPAQGSHMLSSLPNTEGLILVPPEKHVVEKGEKVEVALLPEGVS